jgi:hypothetical protein
MSYEIPIETIRAELQRRYHSGGESLRALAREIPMSPSGLHKLLNGTTPYLPTREKLQRWYVRHASNVGEVITAADVEAALHVLTFELGREPSESVRREMLDMLNSTRRLLGLELLPELPGYTAPQHLREAPPRLKPGMTRCPRCLEVWPEAELKAHIREHNERAWST